MTADFVQKNLEELRDKEAQHILEVRTLSGQKLDLTTFTPVPPTPVSPAPVFRLDSAKDDDNENRGRYIPSMVGDDDMIKGAPTLLSQKDRDVEMVGSLEDEKATAASAATEEAPPPVFEQLPLSASSAPAGTMKAEPPPPPPAQAAQKPKKKL